MENARPSRAVDVIFSQTAAVAEAGSEVLLAAERAIRETLRREDDRLSRLIAEAAGPADAAGAAEPPQTAEAARPAGAAEAVEVGVTLVDDAAMRDLNSRYLGRDRPTDVMAFFMGEREGSASYLLGDVVVSLETARRQAADYGRPLPEEAARLVAHGTLHLLGYRDDYPRGRAAMRALEDAVLVELGFDPGPEEERS